MKRHCTTKAFAVMAVGICLSLLPLAATARPPATPTLATPAKTDDAPAGSITVEGVVFEPASNLDGVVLKLNGAGIRSKFFAKVYAAGLYLQTPAATPAEVYTGKGPKRMKVSFLREVDATTLGKSLSQVMSDNLPRERFGKCIPGIIKLGEVFAEKKKMGIGETYTLDEIPGKGTVVSINNKVAAEITEPEFFTCLMYNYFGDRPADAKLKSALLGEK